MTKYVLHNMRKQRECFPFILMLLGSFVLSTVTPYLNGAFLDFLTSNHTVEEVVKYSLLIACIGVLGAVVSYVANMTTTKILTKTAFSLLIQLTTHIEHIKLQYVEKQNAAYITQRAFNDVVQVTTFIISNFLTAILYSIQMFGIALLFFFLDPFLLVLIAALLIPYTVLFLNMREPLYNSLKNKKEADNSFFGKITDEINNVFYIQLNSEFEQSSRSLNKEFQQYLPKVLKANRLSYFFSSTDSVISTLFQSVMFVFGGVQIIRNEMSIGEFLMINSYFSLMLKAVKYFSNIYKSYQDASSSYGRITEYLQTPTVENGEIKIDKVQKINIDNLSYSFESSNTKAKIFSRLSYSIMPGNVYAIVGANGSGKSTLLKILIGLYETENAVFVNGYQMRDVDMELIRQNNYAVVPQKLLVPSGTLQDFLAKTLQVSTQKVVEVLKNSNHLEDYVESIISLLDNECKTLSGGELRKVHLWIAANKHSDALFLDEPSTGLDEKSKKQLIDYIRRNPSKRIIVVMTHDIDMIDMADHVLNIQKEADER